MHQITTLNDDRFIIRAARGEVIIEDWQEPKAVRVIRLTIEEVAKIRSALESASKSAIELGARA